MADSDFESVRKAQAARNALKAKAKAKQTRLSFDQPADKSLYGDRNDYDDSINPGNGGNDDGDDLPPVKRKLVAQYTPGADLVEEIAETGQADPLADRMRAKAVSERESDYQKQRYNRVLTPSRLDQNGEEIPKSYKEIMEERDLEREEKRVAELIKNKALDKENDEVTPPARKRRWDQEPELEGQKEEDTTPVKKSRWDQPSSESGSRASRRSRWDQTPQEEKAVEIAAPTTEFKSNLSDTLLDKMLPDEGYEIVVPPEDYVPIRTAAQKLQAMSESTPSEGFVMLEENTSMNKGMALSLPSEVAGLGALQFFKESDTKYFGKLIQEVNEDELSVEEIKERKIMKLLLRIKNGTPPIRKSALRQMTDNARSFGPSALFNQILPLLMEQSLEDQERHLLVKVIDRILYKLGDLVRPYTHKILIVIEPLLIDQDFHARAEGREIISNLSKAAGLAHMIATMRPDIDHADEIVRNTTSRAFAVVASALGIPSVLPFLKAVCKSRRSWTARHTGVKIVQQTAVLMGCAVLPHLKGLVDCIGGNLTDEEPKVRTMTALAISALAEASAPYGIESFDSVLQPLWDGVKKHRGRALSAFLKCIGFLIPLMDPNSANHLTRQVMAIILREFSSPDEDMKQIVLKVVQQCSATEGVSAQYLREEVIPPFFKNFWVRRMALERRSYRLVVETTVELAQKVGVAEIIERVVIVLKDESEPFRKMAVETVDKVITSLGVADISDRLEEQLIDGMLTAFQSQTVEDIVLLNGFGSTINALGVRTKPYIQLIVSAILYRFGNQSPTVRQQAADLITRIAIVMKKCDEDVLMGKLGNILYEQLGEEYPEVLGSMLGAMRSIVTVVGLNSMQPPIRDLVPRLTPILRNRHEKVQENTIDLVGRIADRGAEYVSAREWMRICFELLDMLKAHKKGIRRAANNTFGYIAKAIGPQDVLATLLSNLRVQERQSRVCTAVAIGIVAETCAPFTVLPALMNEYRVPDMNVQNGVLKSLTFMFEYIGDMAKDYIYAVTPLIEDALIDRDQVHRQTAATVVKHLALGCVGVGCEDAMVHFLNLLFPNIFETSPHVIDRILDGIDGIRNAVGPGIVLNYVWAGLFQAARKVRDPYWRLYNTAYVQSADAMVPYYPEIEDPMCRREELNIWL